MANASLKQKCLAIVRGMDSKQANVREHLIHKKSRKQITFSGTYAIPPARYVELDSHEPTSFFYPDYNCRLWNYTRSCFWSKGHLKRCAPLFSTASCWTPYARGLYHRSGIAPCPEGFYLVIEIIPLLSTNCIIRAYGLLYLSSL